MLKLQDTPELCIKQIVTYPGLFIVRYTDVCIMETCNIQIDCHLEAGLAYLEARNA